MLMHSSRIHFFIFFDHQENKSLPLISFYTITSDWKPTFAVIMLVKLANIICLFSFFASDNFASLAICSHSFNAGKSCFRMVDLIPIDFIES